MLLHLQLLDCTGPQKVGRPYPRRTEDSNSLHPDPNGADPSTTLIPFWLPHIGTYKPHNPNRWDRRASLNTPQPTIAKSRPAGTRSMLYNLDELSGYPQVLSLPDGSLAHGCSKAEWIKLWGSNLSQVCNQAPASQNTIRAPFATCSFT